MEMMIQALWMDGLQTRCGLDEVTVGEYAEAMRNGDVFPPVKVFEEPCAGAYYLADGFHRVEAARRCGRDSIDAEVVRGTFIDALRHALGCNAHHGKRVTNDDKRRAMELAWNNRVELFGGEPSAALLASTCGVHRNTAGAFLTEHCAAPKSTEKHRAAPSAANQVAQFVQPDETPKMPVRRVGKDGKTYPVRPTRPEPAQVPEHVVPVDRYGVEIPLEIGAAFGEDRLGDILSSISIARCVLRRLIADGEPQVAAVRQDALLQLDNAYNFVAAAKPHCVCRMCQGNGCKACHNRGWQTEEEYNRNPKEFRA